MMVMAWTQVGININVYINDVYVRRHIAIVVVLSDLFNIQLCFFKGTLMSKDKIVKFVNCAHRVIKDSNTCHL